MKRAAFCILSCVQGEKLRVTVSVDATVLFKLYTDLYDETVRALIEATGIASVCQDVCICEHLRNIYCAPKTCVLIVQKMHCTCSCSIDLLNQATNWTANSLIYLGNSWLGEGATLVHSITPRPDSQTSVAQGSLSAAPALACK